MKDKFILGITIVLALTTGALGATVLRTETAEAQQRRQWHECFVADFNEHADGNNPEHMRQARGRIPVPPGWTPVGGVGTSRVRNVVLCR